MASTLTKHPAENRQYTFQFGQFKPGVLERDTVFDCSTLQLNDNFLGGLSLPLLFSQLMQLATPSLTVTDQNLKDQSLIAIQPTAIVLASLAIGGNSTVTVFVKGGADLSTYLFKCTVTGTSQGQIVVGEGYLRVLAVLP
jgi:hypothetical protein